MSQSPIRQAIVNNGLVSSENRKLDLNSSGIKGNRDGSPLRSRLIPEKVQFDFQQFNSLKKPRQMIARSTGFGRYTADIVEQEDLSENPENSDEKDLKPKTLQPSPVIVVPQELLTDRKAFEEFVPFTKIIRSQRENNKYFDNELTAIRPSRGILRKQLNFNRQQEDIYSQTINQVKMGLNQTARLESQERLLRERRMPRIKILKSKSLTSRSFFEEDYATRDSERNMSYQKNYYIPCMYSQTCRVYVSKSQEQIGYRPEVREGASFISDGRYGYLYGGMSSYVTNILEVLDTVRWTWSRLEPKGDAPTEGRFGHTANLYKNIIVVFGGEKKYNKSFRVRECLDDVRLLLLDTKEWRNARCSGESIQARRNHIAQVIGSHLIVHGGISTQGLYLSDLMALNLTTFAWEECVATGNDHIGLSFHASCLVIHPKSKGCQMYRMDSHHSEDMPIIQEQGIYVFGGKNEYGEATDKLRILRTGQKPLKWIIPETQGRKPFARFMHAMIYLGSLNIIVIHGGRNDSIKDPVPLGCYNDIHILHPEKLMWLQVTTGGIERTPRFSQSAAVFGTKMVVFGGMNFKSYCESELEINELDPIAVAKLHKETIEPLRKKEIAYASSPFKELQENIQITKSSSKALRDSPARVRRPLMTFLPIPRKEDLKEESKQSELNDTNKMKLTIKLHLNKLIALNRVRGTSLPNLRRPILK